ncbi:MAG TPA: serine/threonine-protein kinase, partial [Gemmatimonadales bacterium]|nr:serine/threonine-protein kinase [Gemmatimonadales bacterium]
MAEAAASAGTFDRLQAALAGRYALVRELGHGGMATVYLARDAQADREVAIKVLLPELGATLGADRFLREVTLAGSLDHPNIMGMYDSGEADGLLYYVMPYIKGESLRDRLERVRQLSVTEALAITDQVAAALAHAHAQGVIHRDIKPENILLSGDHAVVADFGVARAVTVAGGEKLTQTGMAVGTPTYMSPEQAAGSRDVTPQSDQYSLACTVYEMLAGQPPFTGPTAMSIMARHSLDAVPSLRIVRSAVPDEVEDALFCALEKVPADRFPSVEAFAHALHTPGATPTRRRTERTVTTSVPARRLRRWHVAALAGAAVAVLGAGAWWFTRHRGPAAPSGPDPRQVAVLYFDDQSPDHQLRYLADGLTEALIHELSDVSALHVISRNGVLPYKGTAVTPDSVARALHVGTLVEGSVAASDSLLRVSVSLVNPRTGAEIASKQLERPRKELFALQDDIAKEVSIFLRRQLGQEVQLRGARAGTSDIAAWEAFQRGEQALRDADTLSATGDTKAADGAFLQADSLFAVAQNRDHRWGAPLVQRGWISYKRWRLAGVFDKAAYGERFPEGIRFATQALALNRSDADALELEGTLRYWRWLLNLAPDGDSA